MSDRYRLTRYVDHSIEDVDDHGEPYVADVIHEHAVVGVYDNVAAAQAATHPWPLLAGLWEVDPDLGTYTLTVSVDGTTVSHVIAPVDGQAPAVTWDLEVTRGAPGRAPHVDVLGGFRTITEAQDAAAGMTPGDLEWRTAAQGRWVYARWTASGQVVVDYLIKPS